MNKAELNPSRIVSSYDQIRSNDDEVDGGSNSLQSNNQSVSVIDRARNLILFGLVTRSPEPKVSQWALRKLEEGLQIEFEDQRSIKQLLVFFPHQSVVDGMVAIHAIEEQGMLYDNSHKLILVSQKFHPDAEKFNLEYLEAPAKFMNELFEAHGISALHLIQEKYISDAKAEGKFEMVKSMVAHNVNQLVKLNQIIRDQDRPLQVIMFPEGTRNKDQWGKFHGLRMFAKRGFEIVPVMLEGAQDLVDDSRLVQTFNNDAPLKVRVLPHILPTNLEFDSEISIEDQIQLILLSNPYIREKLGEPMKSHST